MTYCSRGQAGHGRGDEGEESWMVFAHNNT